MKAGEFCQCESGLGRISAQAKAAAAAKWSNCCFGFFGEGSGGEVHQDRRNGRFSFRVHPLSSSPFVSARPPPPLSLSLRLHLSFVPHHRSFYIWRDGPQRRSAESSDRNKCLRLEPGLPAWGPELLTSRRRLCLWSVFVVKTSEIDLPDRSTIYPCDVHLSSIGHLCSTLFLTAPFQRQSHH